MTVATKADLRTAVADLRADMRKVAIGIVVPVALANAGLAFAMAPLLGDA